MITKFSYYIYGAKLNLLSSFSFIWLFVFSVAIFNFNHYYDLSIYSTIVFYIPIFSLSLGSYLGIKKIKIKKIKYYKHTYIVKKEIKNFYFILAYGLLVLSLIIFYIFYKVSLSYGFDLQELRNFMFNPSYKEQREGIAIFSKLVAIIWLTTGLSYYLLFLSSFNMLYRVNFRPFHLFIIASLSMVTLNLSMGGRLAPLFIANYVIAFSLAVVIFNKKIKQYLQWDGIKKFFKIIFIFMFIVILLVSFLRNSESASFVDLILNYFIKYYTGTYYAFDQMILTDRVNEYQNIRFGLSFWGLDTVVVSGFLRFIIGLDIPSLQSIAAYLFQNGINISSTLRMNATYTMLFPLYIDGGIVYISLYFIFLGYLFKKIHDSYVNKISIISFSLMVLMYIFILSGLPQ